MPLEREIQEAKVSWTQKQRDAAMRMALTFSNRMDRVAMVGEDERGPRGPMALEVWNAFPPQLLSEEISNSIWNDIILVRWRYYMTLPRGAGGPAAPANQVMVPRVAARRISQCECGRPVPHIPQEEGWPVQAGAASEELPVVAEAKVENFLTSRFEPHCGHGVPSHRAERTSTSLSWPHCSQWNS